METSSVKSRTIVKQKPPTFSALTGSANLQLEIAMADIQAKAAQEQDLQEAAFGARAGFVLELDIPVLLGERRGRKTSLACRYIVGIIAAYPGGGYWKYLSQNKIATAARSSRQRVIRLVNEAEAAGFLDVDRSGKCNQYHISPLFERFAKIWVNPALVRDDGLSILQAVWASLVKFRQGKNEATWFTHWEAAEVLGVSYHSIGRVAGWCAAWGYVQKRHRPWRCSSKNEYCLTNRGESATRVFGLKTARPKRGALGKTSKEEGHSYARFTHSNRLRSQSGLSFDCRLDQEPYELLVKCGVNRFIAKSIAVQWRGDYESVRQALVNAAARGDDYYRQMWQFALPPPRFNLAGYAIAALNGARSECHGVPPSKLAEAANASRRGKPAIAAAGCLPEAELERRKKEQIRRLFTTPAKPPTSGKDAESTIIQQNRVKEAEAEYLTRMLAAARRNSRSLRKRANQAQKLRFSDGPCRQAGVSVKFPAGSPSRPHLQSEGAIMRQERRATHAGGPRIRPPDPDNGGKIAAGVLKGMQLDGYDYPVRKLRRSGGVRCVTLPLQVRGFLALEPGVWLLFGESSWPGLVAFFKVTPERYRALMTDDCKEIRQSARKVQKRKGTLLVTIPPRICEILSAEVGDNLIFGLAPQRNMVTVAALKGGGESTGSRRPG